MSDSKGPRAMPPRPQQPPVAATATTGPLRLAAPAKLNLSLAVLGRRADGLHELAGAWALLELEDELLLAPGCSGLSVEAPHGADVPTALDENLAWAGLCAGMGTEPIDACLSLNKRIPVAAGLGGGSSDAAAAWRLGRRWVEAAEAPGPGEMSTLARIGADVPFFAARLAAAWVTGIGEQVTALTASVGPREVVLVHAPFGLSTAAVFAELRADEWSAESPMPSLEPGRNDLLAPARRLRPEIDDLARLVISAGAEPHLTGSGPTLFVLTEEPPRADAVAARLARAGLRVTRTRLRAEAASIEAMDAEEESQ